MGTPERVDYAMGKMHVPFREGVNSLQHFVAGTEGDSLEHRAGPPVLHSREFSSRTSFSSGENEPELARPASTWGRMPAADNVMEFGVATCSFPARPH